jgi:hypothetical protein
MSQPIESWPLDGYGVANSEINVDVYRTLGKVKQDRGVWLDTFFKFRRVYKEGQTYRLVYYPRPAYVFYPDKYIDCDARVTVFSNSIWLANVLTYMEPDVWYIVRVGWGTERGLVYDELLMWMEIDEEKMMHVFSGYVGNKVDIHTTSREFYKQVVRGLIYHNKFEEFRSVGGDAVLEALRGILDFIEFLEVADV